MVCREALERDGGLGLLVRLPIQGKNFSDLVGRLIWKAGEHVGEHAWGSTSFILRVSIRV